MNRNTKIALGVAALAALFLAYKKGVFGGKSQSESEKPTTPKTTAREAAKDVSTTTTTDVIQTAVTERPMPVITQTSSESPQVSVVTSSSDGVIQLPSSSNGSIVNATNAPTPFFSTF